ncbi:MAG: hypothetical protein Q7Q71_01550 [Verrucomicrobiota bacterium JB023]|nr:hypothetical protein [Verrucomicrobiota bacterium JB023]
MRWLLLFLILPADALQLRVYQANRHDRFLDFPESPAPNPDFLFASLPLNGVGWMESDPRRQFTLISPLHFVGASHFKPATGQLIRFLAPDGSLIERTVASTQTVPNPTGEGSDLFLGTLTQWVAASSGIEPFPYLNLNEESDYLNEELIILGKNARAGIGRLSAFEDIEGTGLNLSRAFSFDYLILEPEGNEDDCFAEVGDSGSPTFILHEGSPALIGTHSAIDEQTTASGDDLGTTTYDTFLPHYHDGLNTLMEADGYHLIKAIPASTALTISPTVPSPLRAGLTNAITLQISNTGGEDAENLLLATTQGELSGAAGTDWLNNPDATLRLAHLAASSSLEVVQSVTFDDPGTYEIELSLSSNNAPAFDWILQLELIESFTSWTADLTDRTPVGDDDGDGLGNLLEYALGGNPSVNSLFHETNNYPLGLAMSIDDDGLHLSHLIRNDATERGLTYSLETSLQLDADTWTTPVDGTTAAEVLDEFFSWQTTTLPIGSDPARYYRLRISLSE